MDEGRVRLRPAVAADARSVSALVQAVFTQFVAPDWQPEACAVFIAESSPERFTQLLQQSAFACVAERGERLVGVILLTTPALLAFLFVDAAVHRQGIATALWQQARAHLRERFPATVTVELNASPFAVPAYRALGFHPISAPFQRGGCVATRMVCWLPGLELQAVDDRNHDASGRGPIAAVMVHVAKADDAIAWYAAAFPAARRSASSDGRFAFLVIDGVQLEFVPADAKVSSGAAGTVVYWWVPHLPDALARMTATGAQLYRGPMVVEDGMAMCQIRDPWGNCIGLRGASGRIR